jgi:hypothetical protein
MADRIQIRRDTAANWASANPVLAVGEQGYETDTRKMKIGNGSSTWNTLSYFADTSSVDAATLDGLDSTDFATAAQGALADSAIQSADLATVATSGSYNDLSDQPSIPSITGLATETYVTTAVSNLVDTAPAALDTLNELAAALGDDADFAGTVTTSLAAKANTADLATVATSGAYSDLTGTPTIPSALTDLSITDGTAGQLLSADGDGTYTFIDAASGGGSGGTASFTSTTDLTAGDLVALSTSGTVSGITTQAQTLHSSPVQPSGAATKLYDNVSVAKISDTKYVLAYRNNSGYPVVYIATVGADNTVTTGTQYTFSTTTSSEGIDLFWNPIDEIGVVVSTTANQVKYQYFTVIGNAISYQGISGAGQYARKHHAVYNYETNEIWVAWLGENYSARYGGLHKAVWNGSTISITNYSLGFTLRNEKSYSIRALAAWGTDKVIGEWYDGYNPINRDLVFNTSTETWTAIATSSSSLQKLVYNSDANIVIGINYSDHTAWVEYSESGGVVTKGSNFPVTSDVDGNAITWGTNDIVDARFINGKTYILSQSVYEQAFMYSLERTAQNNYNIELIFDEAVSGSYDMGRMARDSFATCGSGIVYVEGLSLRKLDFADLSVTNIGDFIGISTETVTANNPAVISIVGGINTNQSGLTPNLKYYATAVGALTTTLTDYPVGIATSATDLLVTESYNSTQKKTDLQLATVATTGAYSDLTGTPTGLATETYVDTAVSNLVDTAPDALNTLNELAASLNDDADFAGTVTTSLAAKANSADLATVATSGSYTDLSDQPTVPSDVSDLTDTTSLLGGGGGSFEAVASGSLSDGSTVVLNADGTVSVVAETTVILGTENIVNDFRSDASRSLYIPSIGKVIIIYGYPMTAVVGTVSGSNISFGTPTLLDIANINDALLFDLAYDESQSKLVVVYRSSSYIVGVKLGSISGDSISFGSETVLNSSNGSLVQAVRVTYDASVGKPVVAYGHGDLKVVVLSISGTSVTLGSTTTASTYSANIPRGMYFDSLNNKIVIMFSGSDGGWQFRAIVGTVSGTSISFGAITSISNANTSWSASVFDTNLNKVVAIYRNDSNSYGAAKVGTVSGTSISFGNEIVFLSSAFYPVASPGTFDSVNNKIVFTGQTSTGSQVFSGTISGSSITFDTPVTFTEASTVHSIAFDTIAEKVVLAYRASGDLYLGVRTFDTTPSPATNLTAENYAGIADAAYADAATATIQTAGSVDDAQSGLTPGQAYYVQADGTLGLTPDTPRVFAGVAASATKLLIGKEGPAVDLSSYASTSYVDTAVSNLVDTAPEALNTLNELAASLNDDADFAGTVTTSLSTKLGTDSVIDGGTV